MAKRVFIIPLKIVSCFLSVLFFVFTALFIRISIKPIDASFLLPLIEQKLDIPKELHYSSLLFDWDKKSWGPSFLVNDARWIDDQQNIYLGSVSASLNIARLVSFDFRLEKITLKNLEVEAVKKDNQLIFHVLKNQETADDKSADEMQLPEVDYDRIHRYIKLLGSISVENIAIYIKDEDIHHRYKLPYISLRLEAKDDDFQILGYLNDNQRILKEGGQIFASLNKDTLLFNGKLLIENFDVTAFKDYGPLYDTLKPYWPVKGTARTSFESNFEGSLENLKEVKKLNDFQLTANWRLYGKDIFLIFPNWLENPTEIEEVRAFGTFNMADLAIAIQAIEIEAQPDKPLYFPEVKAAYPIKNVRATGFLDIQDMALNITNAKITTDKYTFRGSYKAQFKSGKNAHSFSVQIPLMDSQDALSLWPKNSGTAAHRWVSENIKSGQIQGILSMRVDRKGYNDWRVNFNSRLAFKDVLFTYAPDSKDIFAGQAQLIMLGDKINITAPILTTQDINIYSGNIEFTNINGHADGKPIHMHLKLPVDISLKSLMVYLDDLNKDILKKSGFTPSQFSGNVVGDFGIKMELKDDLSDFSVAIEDLGLYGQGEIQNMHIQKILGEQDLSAQSLNYALSPQKVSLSGSVDYNQQKAHISYLDLYTNPQEKAWAIEATTTASIAQINKSFPEAKKGLDAIKAQGSITAYIVSQEDKLKLNLNLQQASFIIPGINYYKKRGNTASLTSDILIDDDISLPNISLEAQNLKITANTRINKGELEKVEFSSIEQNRTRLKATYVREKQQDSLNISGNLDLMKDNLSEDISAKKVNKKAKPLNVNLKLNQLWMIDNVTLRNITGELTLLEENIYAADITGEVGSTKTYIKVTPQGNKRKVSVASNDGGAIIRGFGINQSIYGGQLKIEGNIDDSQEKSPFLGQGSLTDFTVKDAPILAHLLGILNLVQLDNSLQGKGLKFQEAIIPFLVENQTLYINNAKVAGSTLNGTMNGWVSLKPTGNITLSGKIIPFNTISNTASKIPVLGTLLTGVEKEGIFAADYKVSGSRKKPQITSNPLTSVAPGVVRDLFGAFGNALSGSSQ